MKACIFDLDGTLTNTLESMTYSVNLTLEEMGLSKITKDQCRLFVGNGARVLMEKSLKAAGDTDASRIEEGMEIYGRIFDRNCTYHVTPYEGIPEMLKALKDKGIQLAVLSNKPDRQTLFFPDGMIRNISESFRFLFLCQSSYRCSVYNTDRIITDRITQCIPCIYQSSQSVIFFSKKHFDFTVTISFL